MTTLQVDTMKTLSDANDEAVDLEETAEETKEEAEEELTNLVT